MNGAMQFIECQTLNTKANFLGVWRVGVNSELVEDTALYTADLTISIPSISILDCGSSSCTPLQISELQGVGVGQQDYTKTDSRSSAYLLRVLFKYAEGIRSGYITVRFLLNSKEGMPIRSDIIERRLSGCPEVDQVESFMRPGQLLKAYEPRAKTHDISDHVFAAAVGAMVLREIHGVPEQDLLSQVTAEISRRMSLTWLLPGRIDRKILVIVGLWGIEEMEKYITAARNLDIALVLVDGGNSWLKHVATEAFCELFLEMDLTPNDSFPSRLTTILSEHVSHIDGIMTVSDELLASVATAAQLLNLPTASPSIYQRSINKYETRQMNSRSCGILRVTGERDLRRQLAANTAKICYPVIVKPSVGCNSQGVAKVANEAELQSAVTRAKSLSPEVDVLIETYIDGPEVDLNFVLCDGEVLFSELGDDFPCSGDWSKSMPEGDFHELNMVYPSALPSEEQILLHEDLQNILADLGFTTGVFHVEARVQGSKVKYTTIEGLLDLDLNHQSYESSPSTFLIEVNARAPAGMLMWATEIVYGVDYAALHMLASLGDHGRLRLLSQPFLPLAQTWCNLVLIPAHRGGILDCQDVCEDLRTRRPDLMEYIRYSRCIEIGTRLPDPASGFLWWVAWFCVVSSKSRREVLDIGDSIRNEVRVHIRDEDL